MKKKYYLDNYYKKLLAFLILVSLVPLLTLSLAIRNLISERESTLIESQKNMLQSDMSQLEIVLKHVDNMMIAKIMDSEWQAGISLPRATTHFTEFNSLNRDLWLLQSPEIPFDDVVLFSNIQNWAMSVTYFGDIENSGYSTILKAAKNLNQTSLWYENEDSVYLIKQLPVNTINGRGTLLGKFSKIALFNLIVDDNHYFSTVVLDKNGTLIIGSEEHLNVVKEISSSDKKFSQEAIIGNAKYQGKSYSIAYAVSSYNDWIYYSIIPTSKLRENLNYVSITMLIVFISTIILIILCAMETAKRLYHPIDELTAIIDKELEREGIMPLSPSEKETLANKVKFMIGRNVEMRKKVNNREKDRRRLFLREMYLGEQTDISEQTLIEMDIINKDLKDTSFYTVALQYQEDFDSIKDRKLFQFGLKNIVEELLNQQDIFEAVDVKDIVYFIYYKQGISNEAMELRLLKLCEMLVIATANSIKLPINIGVSRRFEDICGIPNAVIEANAALKNAIEQKGVVIFYDKKFIPKSSSNVNKLRQIRKQIIYEISTGNRDFCKELLNQYFVILSKMNYYLFKLEVNNLISVALEYYSECAIIPDYSVLEEIFNYELYGKNFVEKLRNSIWNDVINPIFKTMEQQGESETIINKIIEYLDSNINSDISLEQCAKVFSYNPNYLSRMIKGHFGKTFTEYVIEKKLEKCKDLLIKTDISIGELAEMFGYNNAQNFIRVFKRYVFMTPGQYRSNYRSDKE
jgi:AraC-type DNA-binding domain-containing proteins